MNMCSATNMNFGQLLCVNDLTLLSIFFMATSSCEIMKYLTIPIIILFIVGYRGYRYCYWWFQLLGNCIMCVTINIQVMWHNVTEHTHYM